MTPARPLIGRSSGHRITPSTTPGPSGSGGNPSRRLGLPPSKARVPCPAVLPPALQAEIIELLAQAGVEYLRKVGEPTGNPPRGHHREPVKPARRPS